MPKSPHIPNYTFKSMVIYCVGVLIPQQPYGSILKRNHVQQIYTKTRCTLGPQSAL